MSGSENDKIQFRGLAEKEALNAVDRIRLGGINVSELARQGVREMLQRTISTEEKIKLYQLYTQGELNEDAARLLLGDALDEIEREREVFESATAFDIDGVYQD